MLALTIGSDINGNKTIKSLIAMRNLFVSYQDDWQIKEIITTLISSSFDNIGRLLIITKETNKIDTSKCIFAEIYVYNNPESGTIKNKNQLFAQIIKEQKKQNKDKTANAKMTVIWIDDMWQFYPKMNSKNSVEQFRQLLQSGFANNIHFIIGSILPYRNLLVQLMQTEINESNKHIVSTLGAELIYTPDGLIFFREHITGKQEILYPCARELALL